ncbi:MAG: AI-2E family transporter [Lachnospiraceae bacterium]|nr:AI-2E family transporter [Lachnospiraceae bacterium]
MTNFKDDREEKDIITVNSEGRIRNKNKNPKFDNHYFKWGLTFFVTFLCCILSIYIVFYYDEFKASIKHINKILSPVYVGFIIAYLYSPLLNLLETKVMYPIYKKIKFIKDDNKMPLARGTSIIIIIILSMLLVYAIIQIAIKQVIPSLKNIVSNIDIYLNNITVWFGEFLEDNPSVKAFVVDDLNNFSDDISSWVNELFKTLTGNVFKFLSQSFLTFIKKLWNFIIGFIISIYVLWSKEHHVGRSKKVIYSIFPRETANALVEAFRYTHRTFIGFFFGKIIDSILVGLICFMGCTLMQIPYAILISIIVGVTNIIPFFGPYFGAIPSTILIFAFDPLHPGKALAFVLFIIALQQFDGNVLGPRILSTSTGLTGFWIIFSITLFGGLFGVFGMVIGVPVFAVIYAGLKQFGRNRLKKKGYPYRTTDYIEVGSINEDGSVNPIPPIEKRPEKKAFISTVIDNFKSIKNGKEKKKK